MAYHRFPSLAHPTKYAYAFDTSAYSSSSETCGYFRQFETYGDGLTQHGGDWSVMFAHLTDFLASLAEAMLSNPELIRAVGGILNPYPHVESIEFAASVVFRESDEDWTKRRYYSVSLKKIGNRTKEHDKRFSEIHKYLDGSCASILRLVLSDYSSGLERYLAHETIRLWAMDQKKRPSYGEQWKEYFNGDWSKNNALRNSLAAARAVIDSARQHTNAVDLIANYRLQLTREAEAEAEALAEAVSK